MTGKKITTWVHLGEVVENPDDFSDPNNFDAPDIPERHKISYAHDLWNQLMGRCRVFWTPRRRMINSIERKEEQVEEKRAKHLQERQAKMDTCGEQRRDERARSTRATLIETTLATNAAKQEEEDTKSVLLMLAVFFGSCLIVSSLIWMIDQIGG